MGVDDEIAAAAALEIACWPLRLVLLPVCKLRLVEPPKSIRFALFIGMEV